VIPRILASSYPIFQPSPINTLIDTTIHQSDLHLHLLTLFAAPNALSELKAKFKGLFSKKDKKAKPAEDKPTEAAVKPVCKPSPHIIPLLKLP
jgi:hypothetical protein